MKRKHALLVTFGALSLAGAGFFMADCAGPGPAGSDPSALVEPLADACRTLAVTRCERMDACTGGTWIAQFFDSIAACEEHVGDACALRASAPGASVTSSSLDACTAALSDATCAEFFAGVAACHPATGSLAADAPCTYPLQCASAWCAREPGSDCGVCAARPTPPAGVPCGDARCAPPGICLFGHCAIPIAGAPLPSETLGAVDGVAIAPDPRLADGVTMSVASECEGGCAAGYTCLSITIPSLSDPAQHTTRFGCAPIGSDPLACAHAGLVLDPTTGECELPEALLRTPPGAPVPAEGLGTLADSLFVGSARIETDRCDGGCAAGSTCLGIDVPSVSDPSRTTRRYGCAPIGSDPLATATAIAGPAPRAPGAPGPVEGLTAQVDPRLAAGAHITLDALGCDGGRGCGAGFTCLSLTIPTVSDPSRSTTRLGCAPGSPDGLACARAGLWLDPATGECAWPAVARAGDACGASHPGVVCGGAGRCVRAADGDSDGVCAAASPIGGPCFADRARGPGCMAPAYCERSPGALVGTCTRPSPALCE